MNKNNVCPYCGDTPTVEYVVELNPFEFGEILRPVSVMCTKCQTDKIKEIKFNSGGVIIEAIKEDGEILINKLKQ